MCPNALKIWWVGNHINLVKGLDKLTALESLGLFSNSIKNLPDLAYFHHLKTIAIQDNPFNSMRIYILRPNKRQNKKSTNRIRWMESFSRVSESAGHRIRTRNYNKRIIPTLCTIFEYLFCITSINLFNYLFLFF